MRIVINREKCEGTALCVAAARDVFDLDDEFTAIIVPNAGGVPAQIRRAAQICPTGAITLTEDDGAENS